MNISATVCARTSRKQWSKRTVLKRRSCAKRREPSVKSFRERHKVDATQLPQRTTTRAPTWAELAQFYCGWTDRLSEWKWHTCIREKRVRADEYEHKSNQCDAGLLTFSKRKLHNSSALLMCLLNQYGDWLYMYSRGTIK